jgi:hypothetical protein
VLRQVVAELAPLAQADPAAGLELCQAMWQQPYLEFRLMACSLLGELPADPPLPRLDQVSAWVGRDTELRIFDALAHDALKRVRKEHPSALVRAIQGWLAEKDLQTRRLGLRALLTLAGDPDYPNLPVIFRLLQPFIRQAPSRLRPDILDILSVLARQEPVETASFLRQILSMPESPDVAWVIRQVASAFPPEQEERLRSAVRSTAWRE